MFRRIRRHEFCESHQDGAQRASSAPLARLAILSLAIALVGAFVVANPTPAAAAGAKVVIIVGPVGSNTANYSDNAKRYASQARSYGANVVEIYSPNATWSRVKSAAQGANLIIYLGHGNGSPSPYGAFSKYTKDGFGLNKSAGNGNSNTKYWGEYYIQNDLHLAPNAVVILNRLCYASGNSEWGTLQPDEGHRHQAHRQLRCGLPARGRAGGLRRGDHQRLVHPVRAVQDHAHDRRDLPELAEVDRRPRVQVLVVTDARLHGLVGSIQAEPVLPLGHRQPGAQRQDVPRQLIPNRTTTTTPPGPYRRGRSISRTNGGPGPGSSDPVRGRMWCAVRRGATPWPRWRRPRGGPGSS